MSTSAQDHKALVHIFERANGSITARFPWQLASYHDNKAEIKVGSAESKEILDKELAILKTTLLTIDVGQPSKDNSKDMKDNEVLSTVLRYLQDTDSDTHGKRINSAEIISVDEHFTRVQVYTSSEKGKSELASDYFLLQNTSIGVKVTNFDE